MKHWTTQAEQRLEEYLRDRAVREGFDGEDAVELRGDLKRHIHEEAEQANAAAIGLVQLEELLGKLDAGYRPAPAVRPEVEFPVKRRAILAWIFGVILPALVLILEVCTSMCGSVLFNPVPTWWHAAWLATVPLLNGWLLWNAGAGDARKTGAAAGFALMTAGFYGLMFLPVAHWALLGLVFFGFGLLPLTPVLAAVFSWRISRRARLAAAEPRRFRLGWRLGALAALAVLLALEGPALWTRANLGSALGGGKAAENAIARLRAFHSERALLKACYEGNRGMGMATDISGWIFNIGSNPLHFFGGDVPRQMNSDNARDVFFRVTGKPFNSLKPPMTNVGSPLMGRQNRFEEFEFDDHLGGDDVAVRLKNLDLAESRLDCHVDSVSQLGYGEWTMVFRNGSAQEKEARCQVRLPHGGRVSRLTLWVNGEPREAAFSSISKVKAAYKAVAVVQRRDPVLVNMVGPNTVMVQCFPVPARGEMKIRLGITALLDGGRWELPWIVERNFGVAEGLEHALWLQGDREFGLAGKEAHSSVRDGDGQSLSASLAGPRLLETGTAMRVDSLPEMPPVVWCEDRFATPAERYLTREAVTKDVAGAGKLVVVIDGSVSMAGAKDWLSKSLGALDAGKVTMILADDHARRVTAKAVESFTFSGGRDNEPALREGIRLAREASCPLVWIHGPQAVRLAQPEALLQLLERGTVRAIIHDVEAVPGPNRLAEEIFRTGCLHRGPTLENPAVDLTKFFERLLRDRRELAWHWQRAAGPDGLAGSKVWDQLARFWAGHVADSPGEGRSELAARYQLVTPVSGAVVLETQEQYDEHGLTPADGDATPAIPTVPELSTLWLLLLTTTAALCRRRR